MKAIYIYIILVTFLTASSCQNPDEFLDVVPTGRVIPTTLEDFDKLLLNYAIIRDQATNIRYMDPDVYQNQASFTTISSNNVSVNAYTWQHQLFNETQKDQDYNYFYFHIHTMNQILQEVDGAEPGNFNAANRNVLKAEALGQRAMEYFLTVNQYAHHYDPANLDLPGVPMPLQIDLQALTGRSTVAEVYNQILSDINEAISLLPDNYQAINTGANFRPGKASLYALLAEVNLFMGDFEAAKTNSNMALSMYDYLYDYKSINFSDPSNPWSGYAEPIKSEWLVGTLNKEVIWQRYNYWSFDRPIHLYSPDLESLYDKTNDSRWHLFATQTSRDGLDVSPNYIYAYPRSERSIGMNVPRLMLTNAEAKVRTNDGPGAIAIINKLLTNRISNFTPLTHSDNAATLQLIKNERRKELAGTSINLFDQKRYHVYGESVPVFTRTNPETNETFTLNPGDDGYVMDIAQVIKGLNPNLN